VVVDAVGVVVVVEDGVVDVVVVDDVGVVVDVVVVDVDVVEHGSIVAGISIRHTFSNPPGYASNPPAYGCNVAGSTTYWSFASPESGSNAGKS
jgi:hypothetical protein